VKFGFAATAPNHKWVADVTYLWTSEGWLYVAVVLDLFSRRVVGWSTQATMTSTLVTDAFVMDSFFSTLKTGRTNRRHDATRDEARADVLDYIERFYNPIRRRSALGNRSPVVFEQQAAAA
jgi:putative transposase